VCQLVEAMMQRRDDLTFRQEMKFRNKLVEYLTDWIMGNSHGLNAQGDIFTVSRYVISSSDVSSMVYLFFQLFLLQAVDFMRIRLLQFVQTILSCSDSIVFKMPIRAFVS
jgi:hypothetical protein